MMNFLSDSLRVLFGDAPTGKRAKAPAKKGAGSRPPESSVARGPNANAAAKAADPTPRTMTPERRELLRQVSAVHRSKQKILADLDDESREKLVMLAFRALLNEGKTERGD